MAIAQPRATVALEGILDDKLLKVKSCKPTEEVKQRSLVSDYIVTTHLHSSVIRT